ncbi:MAG: hypothetical protein V4710_00575 [Verrucomicrobiota bacterium]
MVDADPAQFHNLLNFASCTTVTSEGAIFKRNLMSFHRDRQGRRSQRHWPLDVSQPLPSSTTATINSFFKNSCRLKVGIVIDWNLAVTAVGGNAFRSCNADTSNRRF